MRILIVTRNLPPLAGGMERLNWHMAEELSKVAEVRVIGPEGSSGSAPAGIDVCEAPLKPLWKFLLRTLALAWREAKQWKPDVVLAGSGLTAPQALAAARASRAKTAVYVHGLDIAVRNFPYRRLWLPAIRRIDRVIANSHPTAGLCLDVGIDPARIGIVHPGVDMPRGGASGKKNRGEGANTRDAAAIAFRQCHDLTNRALLLSVGRLSARKGLREFVAQCLPRIVATRQDAVLMIVGDAPKDALHAEAQTPASIRAAAKQAGVAEHLCLLGKISDDELALLYRAADVHVFPIRAIPGDPEGFGMVAVEAAAYGLPTVAFATGGVIDAVAEAESGRLVTPGDYTAFADAVTEMLCERWQLHDSCIDFASQFAWPIFGKRIAEQLSFTSQGSLLGSSAR